MIPTIGAVPCLVSVGCVVCEEERREYCLGQDVVRVTLGTVRVRG